MPWGALRRKAMLTTTPSATTTHARAERDLARRELPEQDEAGQERAAERTERPNRREPAHSRRSVRARRAAASPPPGAPSRKQTRIAGPVPAPTTASAPNRPPRPSQMRPESASTIGGTSSTSTPATISVGPSVLPRVHGIGAPPTDPSPGRDPQQRDPDRRRIGLERQPDVGGGEPQREDLQHADDPGGDPEPRRRRGWAASARSQPANSPRCRPAGTAEQRPSLNRLVRRGPRPASEAANSSSEAGRVRCP